MADDQPEWLSLLALWLRGEGYGVAQASKGADVVPLARRSPPDCFILDYDLGDMKGSQVCQAIKADPRLKGVPVILFTAMAGSMLKAVAEGGPDHFVVKSEHSDELLLVLGDILK
ncbi:MAG: response regulator [Elusimicrobia bacterium]|nr:response regulator [Elusimicrobiota bacterium]